MAPVAFSGGGSMIVCGHRGATVIVDNIVPHIDHSGVTDVTSKLQAMINAAPDGTRFLFYSGGTYRCEDRLKIISRYNLLFEGNGATIKATITAPRDIDIFNGVVEADRVHISSASAPFAALKTTPYAWYVTGPNMGILPYSPGRVDKNGFDHNAVPPNSRIRFASSYNATPGSGKTIKFRHPDDRNRSNFYLEKGSDIKILNFEIVGANTLWATFNSTLEGQHGVDIQGTKRVEVAHNIIHHQWGDAVTLSAFGAILCSAYVHDNEMHHTTRQGWAIKGCEAMNARGYNCTFFNKNNMHDVKRHLIDVEPNGPNQTSKEIVIHDNDLLRGGLGTLAISAYAGTDVFVGHFVFSSNRITDTMNVPVGTNHSGSPRWGPFWFLNNKCTDTFGTGKQFMGDVYYAGHWTDIPAVLKFRYCDGITVTGNQMRPQSGRGMWGVYTQFSTVHDVQRNDMTTSPTAGGTIAGEFHAAPFAGGVKAGNMWVGGGGGFSAYGYATPGVPGFGTLLFNGGGGMSVIGAAGSAMLNWLVGATPMGGSAITLPGFGEGPFGRGPFGGHP